MRDAIQILNYYTAVTALNQNVGQNGGALTGQSIIYTLRSALQAITGYATGSGSVASVNDLGLSLDATGNLDFDASALSSANMTSVQQFLGSTTTGGFLQAANDALNSVAYPGTGIIESEITTAQKEISNENSQISEDQTRVNDLTTSLQAQLSAADAAIATLQSQQTYFTDLFDATYLNNNNGTNGS